MEGGMWRIECRSTTGGGSPTGEYGDGIGNFAALRLRFQERVIPRNACSERGKDNGAKTDAAKLGGK